MNRRLYCSDSAASIAPLAGCPNLEVLDLANNRLDGEDLFDLFAQFKSLRVLYLTGNPIQRAGYYRKRLVSRCAALTYLDTSPVEDLEKRGAEAWARGGRDAELQARKQFQDDKRAAQRATTRRIAAERAARRAAASLAPDGSGRKVLTPEMMAMLPTAVSDSSMLPIRPSRVCGGVWVCVYEVPSFLKSQSRSFIFLPFTLRCATGTHSRGDGDLEIEIVFINFVVLEMVHASVRDGVDCGVGGGAGGGRVPGVPSGVELWRKNSAVGNVRSFVSSFLPKAVAHAGVSDVSSVSRRCEADGGGGSRSCGGRCGGGGCWGGGEWPRKRRRRRRRRRRRW